MFCPNCSYENTQGLNYCKRCGANLNAAPQKNIAPGILAIFLAAIAFITVVGFMLPMLAMAGLSNNGFNKDSLIAMTFFFLLATFGIDFMLIRLLSRLLGFSKQGQQAPHPMMIAKPKYVTSDQPFQQLPEPPITMPSVTEHTTRNFEPLLSREPRSKETS